MKLHYLELGEGRPGAPLVILHGLFGSGDNWKSIAQALSSNMRVIAPDLPNHGASPHTERFHYRQIAEDVADFLRSLGLETYHLLGHSMGGKVAMSLALQWPDRVKSLVVADIAPRRYEARHQREFSAMEDVRAADAGNRREADGVMAEKIDSRAIRAFLLKNYRQGEDGSYGWQFNLDGVREHYAKISDWPEHSGSYTGPVLLVRGGLSPYVGEEDNERIEALFPGARMATIDEAGHWLHAERRDEFLQVVGEFLRQVR